MRHNVKKLRSFIFELLLDFIILFSSINGQELPKSFLFPAKFPYLFVGFGTESTSAVDNAELRYAAFKECIPAGTMEYFNVSDSDELFKKTNYYFFVSPDSLKTRKFEDLPSYTFALSALTKDYLRIFLLDSNKNLSREVVNIDSLKEPDWIKKLFWKKKNYYYSVGGFTSLGRPSDAWQKSEEKAIFNLLRSYNSRVIRISESIQGSEEYYSETATAIKIKYLLDNIEIIERYPDKKTQQYFTLIRINEKDIHSSTK